MRRWPTAIGFPGSPDPFPWAPKALPPRVRTTKRKRPALKRNAVIPEQDISRARQEDVAAPAAHPVQTRHGSIEPGRPRTLEHPAMVASRLARRAGMAIVPIPDDPDLARAFRVARARSLARRRGISIGPEERSNRSFRRHMAGRAT